MLRLDFTSYADTLDCIVSFLTSPHQSPCTIWSQFTFAYDTISWSSLEARVRYDLGLRLCTIWSLGPFLYDINLGATTTMILRIRGVQIPIDLVSRAMDSFRRSVVLFKPMSVPTSDPKSEFLYQSSYFVQNIQTPPEPPRTPGISPTPSSPCITHTVIVQVLLPST